MDLIYADETRKDIGVLHSYELDMAYGSDENDFQCVIGRSDHCCEERFFLYVEGEEFGGIVDSIRVETEKNKVTYKGRTWHGILEKKILCPDAGDNYLMVDGEANEVIQELIERIGLDDLFEASTEDTEVEIAAYQFEPYCNAYKGICDMLKSVGMKLKLKWSGGMVIASAEPRVDYSQDEEFDTSQLDLVLQQDFRPVNHIICLGEGDLKNRAVIHLFTDENGGVQQYLLNPAEEPMQDSDYILDESQKVLTGRDEVTEVLDSSSSVETNYKALTAQPENWADTCEEYFTYEPKPEVISGETVDAGGTYKQVKKEPMKYKLLKKQPYDWADNCEEYFSYDPANDRYQKVSGTTVYVLLAAKPGNWETGYETYFVYQNGQYRSVTAVRTTKYTKQKKKPSDWKKNYRNYYYKYTDGVTTEYRAVTGISYTTYELQTKKPTDWSTRYSSYYRRATSKELKENKKKQYYNVEKTKKNKVPAWKKKTYYTAINHEKPPSWSSRAHYTKTEVESAPTWAANTYYMRKQNAAPTWAAGTYYQTTEEKITPEFISGKYFEKVIDRYAALVRAAIEKFSKYYAADEMKVDLDATEKTYDVGDIVGTIENVTGMSAVQEVKKKIIKINNNEIKIDYEVS